MKVNRLSQSHRMLLLAFLIPALIIVAAGASIGIKPFGDNSLLISDNSAQFAAFFTYFKHILAGNDNFLYSFSKTLGGDMLGFSGYYFQNPLLLMLFLFPDEQIAVGIFWMYVIQVGLLGLSFQILLNSLDEGEPGFYELIFSVGYALSGFVLSYLCLSMYFSSMIMLPIIIVGMDRFLKDSRKCVLYPVALALAIFFNYYIGYMICIFCGIYFVAMLIADEQQKGKAAFKKLLGFLGQSMLGVCLIAFDLIPIVLSLRGQKDTPDSSILSLSINYHPIKLIRNMLPGYFHGDMSNAAAPYIYVGVLPLIGVLLFFLSKKINLSQKIAHLCVLAFLVGSSFFKTTNIIWHGFNEPVGFAYRFGFLICFEMCLVAYIGFKSLAGCGDFFKGHCKIRIKALYEVLPKLLAALVILQILDMSVNSIHTFREFERRDLSSQTEYEDYYNRIKPVINRIQQEDYSLYRIEKDFERNHNDAMMLGYYGLSHNSSCEKDYLKQFMGRMGNRNQGIWSFYNQGSTVFADCLLGVKYFVSRFDSTIKPYEFDFAEGDSYVFENPYVLPFGFVIPNAEPKESKNAPGETETVKGETDESLTTPDLFSFQNGIMREFGAKEAYTKANWYTRIVNLNTSSEYTGGVNSQERTGAIEPENCTLYSKINPDEEAYIEYIITPDMDSNLYFYLTAPYQQGCDVYVDNVFRQDYFTDYRWDITAIGAYKKDDAVALRLVLKDNELRLYDSYIYEEDLSAIQSWYELAAKSQVSLDKITSSHLEGRFSAKEDGTLAFSIPYESGWSIYIDGKKEEISSYKEALMSVKVTSGEHEISMKYVPSGLYVGLVVSIVALILLGLSLRGHHPQKESK